MLEQLPMLTVMYQHAYQTRTSPGMVLHTSADMRHTRNNFKANTYFTIDNITVIITHNIHKMNISGECFQCILNF